MSEAGGMNVTRDETENGVPPAVQIAVYLAYALALALLVFGFVGFVISNAIGDSVGGGAFVLGLIVGAAAYLAQGGSSLGRAVIGLGAAATVVIAVVYVFTGPGSAILPSLIIAVLAAVTFYLLYLRESAKRFYAAR
jgi:hypothetical protein